MVGIGLAGSRLGLLAKGPLKRSGSTRGRRESAGQNGKDDVHVKENEDEDEEDGDDDHDSEDSK